MDAADFRNALVQKLLGSIVPPAMNLAEFLPLEHVVNTCRRGSAQHRAQEARDEGTAGSYVEPVECDRDEAALG